MARPMLYRRLRAPAEDGGVLLDPPEEKISQLIASNMAARSSDADVGGQPVSQLRSEAREQLRTAAAEYTGRYADLAWLNERLYSNHHYLVGHQPELFHPGVWLKNFVLDALAKRDGALAIHVLIDNDEAHAPAIRVPTGSLAEPHIENVAFDEGAAACAWEERRVVDRSLFLSFGERVRETIAPLVADTLVAKLWCDVDAVLASTNHLGRALAQLRHRREIAWGVQTLEVPLSSLVELPAFQFFTAYILSELPRFHAMHNAALAEYRAVHKLRSPSQPLPDLGSRKDQFESPLWVWNRHDCTRRRLWVARRGNSLRLSDGSAYSWELPDAHRVESIAAFLRGMSEEGFAGGFKIRPRALVTTMMLRLVASDLFIHGIGGAKYDQVTDRIIEDFFGIKPPRFLTATGTRLLPIARPEVTREDLVRVDRSLRELKHNPEKWIEREGTPLEKFAAGALIAEKRRLIAQTPEPGAGFDRHLAIEKVNRELEHYYVSRGRQQLLKERSTIEAELRRQMILGSREFSFCLFPETTLRSWLLDGARVAVASSRGR